MLHSTIGQKIGIEHYFSYSSSSPIENSTLVLIEHPNDRITEIRHHYDASNVFSVNIGRSFSVTNDKISLVVKPMIGFAIGSITAINLNLDQEIEWDRFYVSTKFQYLFSPHQKKENFFYTWFESGISFSESFYGGFSLQANFANQGGCDLAKGIVVGFSSGRWDFPVYVFKPFSSQRNIVAGMLYNIHFQK